MIIPNILVIPPAILALIVHLWTYYDKDPVNRLTDVSMLLTIASFGVFVANMVLVIQDYDRRIPSMVLCAVAFGLLIVAIRMRRRQPYGMATKRR
jgi:hypothetical protein